MQNVIHSTPWHIAWKGAKWETLGSDRARIMLTGDHQLVDQVVELMIHNEADFLVFAAELTIEDEIVDQQPGTFQGFSSWGTRKAGAGSDF